MTQNNRIAKNGIKKTAAFFKENKNPVINAASITDHQGRKKEKIKAKISVAEKLKVLIFIYFDIKVCVPITASVLESDCIKLSLLYFPAAQSSI